MWGLIRELTIAETELGQVLRERAAAITGKAPATPQSGIFAILWGYF